VEMTLPRGAYLGRDGWQKLFLAGKIKRGPRKNTGLFADHEEKKEKKYEKCFWLHKPKRGKKKKEGLKPKDPEGNINYGNVWGGDRHATLLLQSQEKHTGSARQAASKKRKRGRGKSQRRGNGVETWPRRGQEEKEKCLPKNAREKKKKQSDILIGRLVFKN